MSLNELTLSGYRCFVTPVTLPFKRVTLLYGLNSSGKSTVLGFLNAFARISNSNPNGLTSLLSSETSPRTEAHRPHVGLVVSSREIQMPDSGGETIAAEYGRLPDGSFGPIESSYDIRLEFQYNADELWQINAAHIEKSGLWAMGVTATRYSLDTSLPRFGCKPGDDVESLYAAMDGESGLSRISSFSRSSPELIKRYEEFNDFVPNLRARYDYEIAEDFPALRDFIQSEVAMTAASDAEAFVPLVRLLQRRRRSLTSYTFKKFLQDIETYNGLRYFAFKSPFQITNERDWNAHQESFLKFESAISPFIERFYDLRTSVSEALNAARSALTPANYIGPLRQRIHGLIQAGDPSISFVGSDGECVPQLLIQNNTLIERLNLTLKALDVPYEISIHTSKDPLIDGSVLKLRASGKVLNLEDVGVGISQVLPIIVQVLHQEAGLLLIEQPELHLHPGLQSRLADVFADGVRNSQAQYIIETHSEHLLFRFQKLIRTGAMSSKDLQVLILSSNGGTRSSVSVLGVAENGDLLDPWPEGFFDSGLADLLDEIPNRVSH